MGNDIVPTRNENNIRLLVEYPWFRIGLTNHNFLLYAFENITQDTLDSETANFECYVLYVLLLVMVNIYRITTH